MHLKVIEDVYISTIPCFFFNAELNKVALETEKSVELTKKIFFASFTPSSLREKKSEVFLSPQKIHAG